jgi:hypothetical protein
MRRSSFDRGLPVALAFALAGASACTEETVEDGDGSSSCEDTELASDPHNCGKCGHNCLGGACSGGVCQPFVLAASEHVPVLMVADGASVYWLAREYGASLPADRDHGFGVAKTGGSAVPIPAAGSPILRYAVTMFANGGHLFVLTGGCCDSAGPGDPCGVLWCDKASPQWSEWGEVSSGLDVYAATADETHLYYAHTGSGTSQLYRYTLDGSAPSESLGAVPLGWLSAMQVDGDRLYLVSQDGIGAIPVAGGDVVVLTPEYGDDLFLTPRATDRGMAVDATHVYWPAGTAVSRVDKATPGPVTVVASWQNRPTSVAVDADSVYWAEYGDGGASNGAIKMAPKGGGAVTVLAAGQNEPSGIAVDGAAVYWIVAEGRAVMKLAR